MKKIFYCIIMLVTHQVIAQPINIISGTEQLNNQVMPAYNVFVPHASVKLVTKEWCSFLKKEGMKVKKSGNNLNAARAVVPVLSSDTLKISSRTAEVANGAVVIVSFKQRSEYISDDSQPEQSAAVRKWLKEFALPVANEGLDKKVSNAEKILKKSKKKEAALIRNNEKLVRNNEKMQDRINNNEKEILENNQKINNLKTTLASDRDALENVMQKREQLK